MHTQPNHAACHVFHDSPARSFLIDAEMGGNLVQSSLAELPKIRSPIAPDSKSQEKMHTHTIAQEMAGPQITLNPKPLFWIIIYASHKLHPFVGHLTCYGLGEEMALPQITQTLHTKPLYWMIIYPSHKLHPCDRFSHVMDEVR
jgi:hypothetical protein